MAVPLIAAEHLIEELIKSGKYKSEEDFAEKECSASEWEMWNYGGYRTCTIRAAAKYAAQAAANSELGQAVAEDTGYKARQERLANEAAAEEEGLENKDKNIITAEMDVGEAEQIEAQFDVLVAKESEIFMKSEWDIFMKELNDLLSQMKKHLTAVEEKLKQAKAGNYEADVKPAYDIIKGIHDNIKNDVEIRLPKIFVNEEEPLHVRDSFIDYYNAQLKFETECNSNFEELAKMSDELEGNELSSEGKRKLQAVVNCPIKSEVGEKMHTDAAKFVDMATPLAGMGAPAPPGKPGGYKLIIGILAVGAIFLATRKKS